MTAIAQDQLGFIWLGTEEGLARYDGSRMKVYGADVLPSARITALAADDQSKLWIGTELGLVVYDLNADSFTRLSKDPIALIRADGTSVWVGLAAGGLQRAKIGQNQLDGFGSLEGVVTGVAADGGGGYWMGLLGGGVVRTDARGQVVESLRPKETSADPVPAGMVTALHVDRNGR